MADDAVADEQAGRPPGSTLEIEGPSAKGTGGWQRIVDQRREWQSAGSLAVMTEPGRPSWMRDE